MQQQSPPRVAAALRRTTRSGEVRTPHRQAADWAARELHDRVGGELALALRQLELAEAFLAGQDPEAAAERLNGSLRAVNQAMQATRELAVELAALAGQSRRRYLLPARPPRPTATPGPEAAQGTALGEKLAALVAGLRPSGTAVRLDLAGLPTELPAVTAHEALRILGEALRNAFTHAQADKVVVRVSVIGRALVAEVEDDGRGFDPAAPRPDARDSGHGLGLASMRQRARALGGNASVVSLPGRGTCVTVRLPLTDSGLRRSGDTGGANVR
jgi:signal transduction histidine kinase